MAPVPAPISRTEAVAGSTQEAMSWESLGELGATAPMVFGLRRSERKNRRGAVEEMLMLLSEDIPSGNREIGGIGEQARLAALFSLR